MVVGAPVVVVEAGVSLVRIILSQPHGSAEFGVPLSATLTIPVPLRENVVHVLTARKVADFESTIVSDAS